MILLLVINLSYTAIAAIALMKGKNSAQSNLSSLFGNYLLTRTFGRVSHRVLLLSKFSQDWQQRAENRRTASLSVLFSHTNLHGRRHMTHII